MDSRGTLSFLAPGTHVRRSSHSNSMISFVNDNHDLGIDELTDEHLQRRLSIRVSFYSNKKNNH
jgi:hypothetical protein